MNVTELDEAEGLTEEMVCKWLARKGYSETQTSGIWQKRETRFIRQINAAEMQRSVQLLATWDNVSPQAILREMNPRLASWPDDDARAAHRGPWLAVCVQDGTACMGLFRKDIAWFSHSGNLILTEEDTFARFWPCDAHGNKVRWPISAPR